MEKIYIYHTNDIHSHFQFWPRIRDFVTKEKNQFSGQTFLFDVGDFVDRFHPYTEATAGKGNVHLLNEAQYDAVTIGNNEGITLSHEELNALYEDAEFPCVIANLFTEDGTRPEWAVPYQIFETAKGTKLGVIGVTIPYTNFYEPLYWTVTDPLEALHHWVRLVKEQADIVIVLSHLGLSDDERIAREIRDVDIILGGHTHHILQNGEQVEGTLLACTGKHGQFLGKVEIEFDQEEKMIRAKRAKLIPTEQLPPAPDESDFPERLHAEGEQLLSVPVACLPKKLPADWFYESELAGILCEGLTEWCEADCSFINAGILIEGLDAGIVTEFDIHQICPHPINPCVFRISGRRLKELLMQTESDRYTYLELRGFGFRGKVFGKIIYNNISIEGKGAASTIKINQQEINPDRIYRVATLDMFAFAQFYPEVVRSEKVFYLPETMRDILKWKLKRLFPYQET